MFPLELVKLTALMKRTRGSPEVRIGLIDSPVAAQRSDLVVYLLRSIPGNTRTTCIQAKSAACLHGNFAAEIIAAKQNTIAHVSYSNCTVFIRTIFTETTSWRDQMPHAMPLDFAAAIFECIDAGAGVFNLSLALAQPSANRERTLEEALNQAINR